MKERIILHIDVNNAFLSWTAVDLLNNGYKKDIRQEYSVIAGDQLQRKGIILAKSTPCKKKGVITGEPIYAARRKCPYLNLYPPNHSLYKVFSDKMYNYLSQYSPYIERYSIDECFIDYTNCTKLFGDPIKLAYKIKDDIQNKLGFTVNVGIGNNKLCAKMASDFEKPNKVHTLFQNEIKTKMWPLPISELFMIGKQTTKKLKDLNINTIKDLANTDINLLERIFKKQGILMHNFANGIDESEVDYQESDPKSVSTSTILAYNYSNKNDILKELKNLSLETGIRLRNKNLFANTISIWIKYNNFTKISKQIKLNNSTNKDRDIYNSAVKLFNQIWNDTPIRGLCVGVSNLTSNNIVQLDLFNKQKETDNSLQKTIDEINKKYGKNKITYADIINKK